MSKLNKAGKVRHMLELHPKTCGRMFTGHQGKKAYDTWSRWERTGCWPASQEKLFDIIITLEKARYDGLKGSDGALELVMDMLYETTKPEGW